MKSFKNDLIQEKLLATYLNSIYNELGFDFTRINDLDAQHQGIDVELRFNDKVYQIDEKAQLHYLNKDIPTFTFELSYLKNHELKKGWLFDERKITDYYFLITGICLQSGKKELTSIGDISKIKITSVNRRKLIQLLERKNLSSITLLNYDYAIRQEQSFGNNYLEELNPKSEGCIYFTEHLSEQPLNLKLNLNYLIRERIAKRLFEN